MTGRERVYSALDCSLDGRVPRQLWLLPWARLNHPGAVESIENRFPPDIVGAPPSLTMPLVTTGDQHKVGTYVDEWGATFTGIQDGVIGEVRRPTIREWDDLCGVRFPRELLSVDIERVNAFCADSDCFVLSPVIARPFERMQFLRKTQDLYIDLIERSPRMRSFLQDLHSFFVEEMKLWAKSEVDALFFMDDWGAQQSLLIAPDLWRELFKPLYKDYVAIAHAAGKKAFMHSDGHILSIIPDLIEIGLDAINSQIFCMGPEALQPFRGKICFWGEVDRQHLLPHAAPGEIARAVARVKESLYDRGGVIAQCEFGAGARPENVEAVFQAWDELTS